MNGDERFIGLDATVLNFWQWAHSDILNNAERGRLAEFIVGNILEIQDRTRTEWEPYDLLTRTGIKVEVKSSAYLQTWHQRRPSELRFSIAPTLAWDKESNSYASEKKRQSHVYVFCVSTAQDKESANPLDLRQWEFFVLPTQSLDKSCPFQKSISLSSLLRIGAYKVEPQELKKQIESIGCKNG